MQSHTRKVYACLAVTCHLHFWQNDRDLLRATVLMVSVDVKLYWNMVTASELRICAKVEVDVLGSTSLTVLMDRVDVKQH